MWITKTVIFMIDKDGDEQQYEEGWEPLQELSRKDVLVSPATTEYMDIRKISVRMLVRKEIKTAYVNCNHCGKSSLMLLDGTVPMCRDCKAPPVQRTDCGNPEREDRIWLTDESQADRLQRMKREYIDMWGLGNPEGAVRSKDPDDLTDYSIFGGMTQEQLDKHDDIVATDIAAGRSCTSMGVPNVLV